MSAFSSSYLSLAGLRQSPDELISFTFIWSDGGKWLGLSIT